MADWVMVDGRGLTLRLSSEAELDGAVDQIETAARRDDVRVVAHLTPDAPGEDEPYLSLVLGDPESVVVFEPGGDGLDSGISLGPADGDTSLFRAVYGTGFAEYERRMVVTRAEAIQAAHEFFRTGRRPTNITWDES